MIDQFKPDRLGADTVSDRASDYDAIRPDVWTHLAFGRGYGSYQPSGTASSTPRCWCARSRWALVGLVAFLLLGLSVVASARATITSRHPAWAPPALAGAAVAVVFLVCSALFDTHVVPAGAVHLLVLCGICGPCRETVPNRRATSWLG